MTGTAVRSALLAAALLGAAGAASFTSPARADEHMADDKKDDKKDKQKEAEKKQREKNLTDIAGYFGSKSVDLLLGRVPKSQKLSLALGKDNTGDYSIDQARGVLNKYFEALRTLTVDFVKADGVVGCFTLTVYKKGEDKGKAGKLYVTLGALGADNTYTLAKLDVQM
jgi:hypothetical protein